MRERDRDDSTATCGVDSGGCFNVLSLKRARIWGVPLCQRKEVSEKENRGELSGPVGGDNKLLRVAFSQGDFSQGSPGARAGAEEAFAGVGEGDVGAKVKPQ